MILPIMLIMCCRSPLPSPPFPLRPLWCFCRLYPLVVGRYTGVIRGSARHPPPDVEARHSWGPAAGTFVGQAVRHVVRHVLEVPCACRIRYRTIPYLAFFFFLFLWFWCIIWYRWYDGVFFVFNVCLGWQICHILVCLTVPFPPPPLCLSGSGHAK